MSSAGSVTLWIRQLQAGEHQVAQQLWERYFWQLVTLARNKLQGARRQAADEEDVALSAFASFCRGAEKGRFPKLDDRDDLWQLLFVIAERKAIELRRFEGRKKRNAGRLVPESARRVEDSRDQNCALANIMDLKPTPELAVELAENFQRRLDMLGDAELQAVALLKLEGYSIEEIAAKHGCVPRTVNRRLRLIRRIWEKEITE